MGIPLLKRALSEVWIQKIIADSPAILGLGDLVLRDRERRQPRAGRLDMLLQDKDSMRRYEVKIQLGATDESYIIKTIEYWGMERKRYPQYEHCAAPTDRAYWERSDTKKTVDLADRMLDIVQKIDPEIYLKYNKFYIGLSRNEQSCNVFILWQKKRDLRIEFSCRKLQR